MLNPFVIKKNIVLLLLPMLSVIFFAVGMFFYNFWIGLALVGVSLLVNFLIGKLLLSNPFTSLLEGKGMLAIDLNSTGVLQPFIVNAQLPYIKGKLNNQVVDDVFSRDIVHSLAIPKINKAPLVVNEDGSVDLHLSEIELNKARFAMYHFPVLLYNSTLKTFFSKEILSNLERANFANNGLLYLNLKVAELSNNIRDFARYIVETLKPKGDLFKNKWVWIIIIILFGVLGAIFLPEIINSIGGVVKSGAGQATSAVTDGLASVTPKV